MCVCVCEREREREKINWMYFLYYRFEVVKTSKLSKSAENRILYKAYKTLFTAYGRCLQEAAMDCTWI